MAPLFIKPDLHMYFSAMPFIGAYLNAAYNKANTFNELSELVHTWLNEADSTNNEVRKQWLLISAQNLYGILTRKSYESKITI